MKAKLNLSLVLFLTFMTSSLLASNQSPHQARLVGSWELESFLIHRGEENVEFCSGAHGLILYEESGMMSVSINCAPKGEVEEPADKQNRILFYAGNFSIHGNEVVHTITNASNLSLIGQEITRTVSELTSSRLVLSGKLGGTGELFDIAWNRVGANFRPVDFQ